MNQQHLTKLANALVKQREKRAALWDKLLRAGKLSENAIGRILGQFSDKALFDKVKWPGTKRLANVLGQSPSV